MTPKGTKAVTDAIETTKVVTWVLLGAGAVAGLMGVTSGEIDIAFVGIGIGLVLAGVFSYISHNVLIGFREIVSTSEKINQKDSAE